MADESTKPLEKIQASRIYEQPPDAITCFCEIAQVTATPHEIVMQFYETVPGARPARVARYRRSEAAYGRP